MTLTNHPQIEMTPISALTRNPNNVLRYPQRQIELHGQLIKRHGIIPPILVSDEGVIVSGEDWYLAAQKLGETHVPILKVRFLTDEQRLDYSLADAKI